MTQEQQDKLRRALYNAKFTTDAHDENPFVGVYFNDLLDIIKDYVEQPLIDKACKWLSIIDVNEYIKIVPGFGYVIEDEDAIKAFCEAMKD